MKRRQFITKTTTGLLGMYLIPSLVSCDNFGGLELDAIIGKSDDILSKYENKEGDNNFCTYEVKNFNSKHNIGTQAYIYCINRKIVGFTIRIEDETQVNSLMQNLDKDNNTHSINYENEFGKEYIWNNKNKKIKLSSNILKSLPSYSFYSEIDSNANLII